ncbi:MAG: hypothetical protein OES47_15470 [Acidobacteriota bacterium]|nr:hypothetical protein [Acidobacteriota bacterium]
MRRMPHTAFFVPVTSLISRVLAVLLILSPAALFAEAMYQTGVVISPFPSEEKEIPLKNLSYGSEHTRREITTVRLDLESKKGEDPVRAAWTFTGSNLNAGMQRVNLSLILLDKKNKRLGMVRKTMVLKAGVREQKKTAKMKVSSERWQAATKVKIEAAFAAL